MRRKLHVQVIVVVILGAFCFVSTSRASNKSDLPSRSSSSVSQASTPDILTKSGLYGASSLSGVALDGYDPVSFFLSTAPLRGQAKFEKQWKGAVWHFSSLANQAAFLQNPEIFVPQFYGYDALMVSRGYLASPDPTIFMVVRNKLYLFRSEENRNNFVSNKKIFAQSYAQWPKISKN